MTTKDLTALSSKDNPYRDFIGSIKSPSTRIAYDRALKYFMQFIEVKEYHRLLDRDPKLIQSYIIDFILYFKDQKKLAPATIASYVAAITHFFYMNDVMLNWKKINAFKGEYYVVVEDQPYSREQIKQMLDKAEQRNRALILLLSSSGIRVGAIRDLKVGDLIPISKYNIYQVTIYKKSKSKYITFCTPECRKEIDTYLQYRERCGEKLTKDSPLFRKTFDRTDLLQIKNNVKPLSTSGVSWILNELLNITGVRPAVKMAEGMKHNQRTSLMQCHGFRKFFSTVCVKAGMNPVYAEMLMGHSLGITSSYAKPTPEDLLEGNDKSLGYTAVINELIINEENRLKRENQKLQAERSEINELHEQVIKMSRMYEKLILNLEKSTDNEQQINDVIESNFEAGAPKPSGRQDGRFIQKTDAFEKFIKNAGYIFDKEIDVQITKEEYDSQSTRI